MPGKAIMVQGTGSNVGKSVIATALCRIFRQDGFSVAPFKSQNMSLNSYVTADGREIGRAQGVQAEAAGIEAEAIMNPILLKPMADHKAQVVLLGRPVGHLGAREYRDLYIPTVMPVIKQALDSLLSRFDIVVIEGAGSPAEINLKERDIANMKIAELANAPVILVGDIDRGGLFASFVGTLELLEPVEADRICGFIVNKFRGDLGLLEPGLHFLEKRTGKPVLGVIPYIHERLVEEEDSVSLCERRSASQPGRLTIGVIQLPHISNFTDFEPLEAEQGVALRYIRNGEPIGDVDAVILPGSKSTVADLLYLRRSGYDRQIEALVRQGVLVIGICGGYQMLGQKILDPGRVESDVTEVEGLRLLQTVTEFLPEKQVARVRAKVVTRAGFLNEMLGQEVRGYEIHMGITSLLPGCKHWLSIQPSGEAEGAVSENGQVLGTYLHDIFHNENFRHAFLNALCARQGEAFCASQGENHRHARERRLDCLAQIVRQHTSLDLIYNLLQLAPHSP